MPRLLPVCLQRGNLLCVCGAWALVKMEASGAAAQPSTQQWSQFRITSPRLEWWSVELCRHSTVWEASIHVNALRTTAVMISICCWSVFNVPCPQASLSWYQLSTRPSMLFISGFASKNFKISGDKHYSQPNTEKKNSIMTDISKNHLKIN